MKDAGSYWPEITKIINRGKDKISMEKVIDMAKEIREFHQSHKCECYGKAICEEVNFLEAPISVRQTSGCGVAPLPLMTPTVYSYSSKIAFF